jgi:hypothetical protein
MQTSKYASLELPEINPSVMDRLIFEQPNV